MAGVHGGGRQNSAPGRCSRFPLTVRGIGFLQLLTDRSVALLAASVAGVVLADPRGELRVAAASSQAAGVMELFQIKNDQGPCLDCFRIG